MYALKGRRAAWMIAADMRKMAGEAAGTEISSFVRVRAKQIVANDSFLMRNWHAAIGKAHIRRRAVQIVR